VAVVLGAELLNTAVEILTDLLHPDHGPAAAAVKDVSAAAVLISAGLAIAVGLLVLLPRVIELSPSAVRGIPLVLGVVCLVILAAGAVRARRPSRLRA
jgi:diacylglycerol kinase-like protein